VCTGVHRQTRAHSSQLTAHSSRLATVGFAATFLQWRTAVCPASAVLLQDIYFSCFLITLSCPNFSLLPVNFYKNLRCISSERRHAEEVEAIKR